MAQHDLGTRYARTVIGYHGCDADVAEVALEGRLALKPSNNDFDWLGTGIYFWEWGLHRAWSFADEQKVRRKVQNPSVLGAVINLGACFDLTDTRFTRDLAAAFPVWSKALRRAGLPLPRNDHGKDRVLRRLDCAVIDWFLSELQKQTGTTYDTVRGAFTEGGPLFPGSGLQTLTHVQIAVRNPACIVGYFRPIMKA